MIKGLDVAYPQGIVDWPSVAAMGCKFAWVKCSEGSKGNDPIFAQPGWVVDHARASGTSGQDPYFQRNVVRAKDAGLAVGPYHFCYPLPHQDGNPLRDPDAQMKFAYDLASGLGSIDGDLPPMIDFEWPEPGAWSKWGCTAAQLRDWIGKALPAADAYWGCPVVLYSYRDFWEHVFDGADAAWLASIVAGRPLNVAHYPSPVQWPAPTAKPLLLRGWSDWTAWQFTGGKMHLPNGVPADFDVFNGDEADIAAFCSRGQKAA